MGRPGITYEMVEAAADALHAERPGGATLTAVRARLGKGSSSTVHKFLKLWNENRPKVTAPVVAIPEDVAKSLSAWVLQASTGARADAEERSLQAQAAADELARAGEALEVEHDQLLDDIAIVTTQRDQAQATADERAAEIQRLLVEVERERGLAGAAQVDAAQARLRAESQTEHLAEMRTRIESLSAAVDVDRTARTAAEREAAVAAAQLGSARAELEAARGQVAALQQEVASGRDRVEQLLAFSDDLRAQHKNEVGEVHQALDSARAQVLALTTEKFQAQGRVVELERSLQAEHEQVAGLKRLLASAQGHAKE